MAFWSLLRRRVAFCCSLAFCREFRCYGHTSCINCLRVSGSEGTVSGELAGNTSGPFDVVRVGLVWCWDCRLEVVVCSGTSRFIASHVDVDVDWCYFKQLNRCTKSNNKDQKTTSPRHGYPITWPQLFGILERTRLSRSAIDRNEASCCAGRASTRCPSTGRRNSASSASSWLIDRFGATNEGDGSSFFGDGELKSVCFAGDRAGERHALALFSLRIRRPSLRGLGLSNDWDIAREVLEGARVF